MPNEEHSSIWYSRSSDKDFIYEHVRSSTSMLDTGSCAEPKDSSNDDRLGGCALICTDLKRAALRKSPEWHISLGDDGNRPSESEPR